jgi:Prion-inhibition and propagation
MEVAGLAIGVAGIAGLSSACVDALERIDSYRKFGIEANIVLTRFEIDKLLLKRWGIYVGIDKGRVVGPHHSCLDDEETQQVVRDTLTSIAQLLETLDQFKQKSSSAIDHSKDVHLFNAPNDLKHTSKNQHILQILPS